ncbi:glycosyltransferase family 2 protein [Mucilaginibacter koreensis]
MVSAVILSYNRRNEVLITVEKLKALRPTLPFPLEIIVVDNASADDTSEQISAQHPDITLITKPKNNGIAGWNEGFKVVKSKYILVLDDDSCIEHGLAEGVNYLENNEKAGILAYNIVDQDFKGDPHLDPEKAWKNEERIVGFIGCGALIRTELYHHIGGFADWIYVYTHEFEYGIRCLNAGYDIVFFDKGVVVHRTSNINRSVKRQRIYATRNEMAIVYKHFGHNRWKYIFRVLVNNLKFIKREGLKSGYYMMLGAFKFLTLRKTLGNVPVKKEVQNFYAENFWSTKPVLNK